MHSPKDIIGTWQLISWQYFRDEAATQFLMNHGRLNPLGRLTFTSDGYMSAILTDPARAIPPDTPFRFAPDRDVANIARALTSYCGQYRLFEKEGETRLSTDVEVSLDPSWIGGAQERKVGFGELGGKKTLILRPVQAIPLKVLCCLAFWNGPMLISCRAERRLLRCSRG